MSARPGLRADSLARVPPPLVPAPSQAAVCGSRRGEDARAPANGRLLKLPRARRRTLRALAAALLLASRTAWGAEFLIEITGSPALQFRGDCAVVDEEGEVERVTFRGFIPKSYIVEAPAVSCSIQKWDGRGRLRVELSADGEFVARAETFAAFNWVTVGSAGPWGDAHAVRGVNPFFSIRRDSGRTVVPPFSTSPVPSLRSPVPSLKPSR